MSSFGIPAKLIRLVRMTMTNVTCQVRVDGKLSGPFATAKDLRQGDGLACLLFNLALERAIRDSIVETTGTIFYKYKVSILCQKHTTTFFNLWLNKELLLPLVIDCWIDNNPLLVIKNRGC